MPNPISSSNEVMRVQRHIPVSTYRLQFTGELTFNAATQLVDYLHALGISDCYASPVFQARPGSTHGYDICDFNRFHAQSGTAAEFVALGTRLRAADMGLLVDMVPNHMGIGHPSNLWWEDVLRYGRHSAYAHYFDIDWDSPHPGLAGKVLLPVLNDHWGKVLEKGELKVAHEDGDFVIRHHDHRFPVSPEGQAFIGATETVLEKVLQQFNPAPGSDPRSFDKLEKLLDLQHYRLAFWRVGPYELNYRRFFDVTDLAAVRMECEEVFMASHQLVLRLLRENIIHGLRIDHPDGLQDPEAYFEKLQETVRTALPAKTSTKQDAAIRESPPMTSPAKATRNDRPLYVVAEKILAQDELLPGEWPVDGTTGYDFLNLLNGLFVCPDNAAAFDRIYGDFIGQSMEFETVARQGKLAIMGSSLISEVTALAHLLKRIAGRQRRARDFVFEQLTGALREFVAALQVYRTYISRVRRTASTTEREQLHDASTRARKARPDLDGALFEFILDELLEGGSRSEEELEFGIRFQQLTGPVMAKGVEDTACYIYNRLVSLNEVGGYPAQFGGSVAVFHKANAIRLERSPHSLLATATHDTKRGEDFRARLNVLSEMPSEWQSLVSHWAKLNASFKRRVEGHPCPDANTEYLLYQTLVGAWPGKTGANFRERINAAMLKSVREAKQFTNWLDPNEPYETVLHQFVEHLLADSNSDFRKTFLLFQQRVAFFGYWNSLAQVILKATAPGVPDFYQGCELWDFSLVDPDNRRAVDFEHRRSLLAEVQRGQGPAFLQSLLANPADGRVKLFLTHRLLTYRREHKDLFARGAYVPVGATGRKAPHVVSYLRSEGNGGVLVVAPRLVVGVSDGGEVVPIGDGCWKETWLQLPSELGVGTFRNILTDEKISSELSPTGNRLSVGTALQQFPVALLERV